MQSQGRCIERSSLKEHAEPIDVSTYRNMNQLDKSSNNRKSENIEINNALVGLFYKIYVEYFRLTE